MKNITTRLLNHDDLAAVVEVHISAFSDRALAVLGREAVHRYYKWQLEGPHDVVALGIFQNGALVGFCFAGVFRGALTGFLRRNRGFLIWRVITHPWLLVAPFFRERVGLAWNLLKHSHISGTPRATPPAKSFGILAIAVDPQIQGAGLGKRLMAETEKIAVERGFSHLHLTVDINNYQAVAFYENLRWQKLPASDGLWHGSMSKDIESVHHSVFSNH